MVDYAAVTVQYRDEDASERYLACDVTMEEPDDRRDWSPFWATLVVRATNPSRAVRIRLRDIKSFQVVTFTEEELAVAEAEWQALNEGVAGELTA
jgi:hypothetical protein